MKPIFSIDITNDKNNTEANGKEFIIRSISRDLSEKLENAEDKIDDIQEKAKLPLWLRIFKLICQFVALTFFIGILRGSGEVTVSQAYANAPYLFWICGAAFALWGAIAILGRAKEKETLEVSGVDNVVENLKRDQNEALADLCVPANALSVDFLVFSYKIKKDKVVPQAPGFLPTPYINIELNVFVENESLCMADMETVHAFSLSEIKAIKKIKKRISMLGWNKNEAPTKGIYKPYKMTVNNMGCIFMKYHYCLVVEREGVEYEIYFPCYELPIIENITSLKAEE